MLRIQDPKESSSIFPSQFDLVLSIPEPPPGSGSDQITCTHTKAAADTPDRGFPLPSPIVSPCPPIDYFALSSPQQ